MSHNSRFFLLALFLAPILVGTAVSSACVGGLSDPGGTDPTVERPNNPNMPVIRDGARFQCSPDEVPSALPMRRLSRVEHLNSLRTALGSRFDLGTVGTIMEAAQRDLSGIPRDGAEYERLDQGLTQAHVDGQYAGAVRIGREATSTPERLAALMGDCAVDEDSSNDSTCLTDFVDSFGALSFKRPLVEAERSFFRDEAYIDGDVVIPEGVAELVAVFLSAPQFLYHVEEGGRELGDGHFELTPFELASRLAYHFWQDMPDAELLAAAADGSLSTDAGFQAQLERVFADPKTASTIDAFFVQWLELDDLAPLETSATDPAFAAFAGSDLPTAELRGHMIEEALSLTRHVVSNDLGFDELLSSRESFAETDDLAAIYGVPVRAGGQVLLPQERPGIFTRAALLSSTSVTTHPIQRGVFIRRRVLCDDLPDPPEGAMAMVPELSATISSRERAVAITEVPGTSCASCHSFINPLGFALEGFDSLGRFRNEETVFGDDGAVLATLPVDSSSVPAVTNSDDRSSMGASDLMEFIQESGKAQACFVRHYYRFTHRRQEEASDGCSLESLRERLAEGGSLAEMLRGVASQPEFRERRRGAL